MKKPRLTAPQFAAAAVIAGLSEDRTQVARSVLVDGLTYQAATAPYGHTRQSGRLPVQSVLRAHVTLARARAAESLAKGAESLAVGPEAKEFTATETMQLLDVGRFVKPRRRRAAPAGASGAPTLNA